MNISYFDARNPIEKHIYRLPHWQQAGAMYFVTWHMADALPKSVLHRIKVKKEQWMRCHPKPWDSETSREYHFSFTLPLEKYLDRGTGSCVLKNPAVAERVWNTLLRFQNERYNLDSFVIMPNHVHLLFQCELDWTLPKLIRQWKGVSSRYMKQPGRFWQEGYWDRIIRSGEHLNRCRNYIRDNPMKAGLKLHQFMLYSSERGHS